MIRITVSIRLTTQQVENYYRGRIRWVIATAADGSTVQLPFKVLHPFISKNGIDDMFVITTDQKHKFQAIDRLETKPSQNLDAEA
ncbi:DUF2835 domain-containing protein [Verrucomicrobia bacterium]|nr:DUF2835 domain-containing protein [Verrucomicrobiota bacterium]